MERRQLMIAGLLVAAALALVVGARACSPSTPTAPSLIAQAEEEAAVEVRADGRPRAPGGYEKREGLHIDIPYLSGRRLGELPAPVIEDQLGAAVSSTELPESEEHQVFERAQVWTYDGRIYRIQKQLSHPMDVPTALGTSGFPLDLGSPINATTEIRWNRKWNQRRIRLVKNEADPRLYDTIDVWRFMPKELH